MYSKYFINICALVISIVITIILVVLMQQFNIKESGLTDNNIYINEIQNVFNTTVENNITQQNIAQPTRIQENNMGFNSQTQTQAQAQEENWILMIPKIDLIATIREGTEQSTINKTIGHFTETSMWEGNVGLAAHNRGMKADFFENIKNLVKNDLIIYQKGDNIKQYQVETVTIIQDNDWSYLQPTKDNRITLITCVKNEPNYRLCVQGMQI